MSNSISSNLYNIKKNVYDFNNQKANNESTVKEAELNKEVLNMSVSALITAYSQGKLTVNDVVQWCNAYNCELNTEEDGVIKFDFQGKSYSISTKQTPASNVADSEFTYTLEDLKNSYKLEDNIIEKFFTKNATVETYTLKPDSGFSTIEELLNHVYNNYTNYNDTEVEVEGAATGGGTEALTGLAYYKARLQGVLASKKASVVQNLLAEFTTDVSSGNITSSVAIQILKLFGAGNITPNVTEKHLKEIFSNYGEIKGVYIPKKEKSNLNKNYAFIEFIEKAHAEEAQLYMDEGQIDGKVVKVEILNPKNYIRIND